MLDPIRAAILAVAACALTGCGPQWVYTFVDAEKMAKPAEKPILVFYRDHLDVKSSTVQDWLSSPALSSDLHRFVLCSLVSAYDPNRRYIGQYGVMAAPALVVVHPDGTYHALTEIGGVDAIAAFLRSAKAPGNQPNVDIAVTRPTDYLMRAEGTYEKAIDQARRQNRKLLIVYKWWLNADSTELIARMQRPEVASRCTETVNCVLDWDYVPNRAAVARYGVRKFPAIIVVNQDGNYMAREGLLEVDEIVRFLTTALSSGRAAPPPPQQVRAGWNWSPYHDRARLQASRTGKGMFIFYHSLVEDESARVTRLLETQTVTAMFADMVHCSLAWSSPRNREIMKEYGVAQSPACVAVRPNGTYLVREGAVTIDDLRELQQFLSRP